MAQCSLALRSALAGRLISLVDQEGGGLIGTSFQRLDLDVRGPAAAAAAGRHGTGRGRTANCWRRATFSRASSRRALKRDESANKR